MLNAKTANKKIRILGALKKTAFLPPFMVRRLTYVTLVTLFLCGIFMSQTAKAQDPTFTQFYANPLYLNPALAGTATCPRVVFNHRNQWPALSGNFVTNSVSYDQYVDAVNGGLGLYVLSDNAGRGTLTQFSVNAIYSYHWPFLTRFRW